MSFTSDNQEKYLLITVEVEKLDSHVSPELKSELVLQNAKGKRNIILDLSQTRYCDSSGLSSILVGDRLSRAANGSLVLCGLQPAVQRLMSISQLEDRLNIIPTLSEAIDFLYMEEIEREL